MAAEQARFVWGAVYRRLRPKGIDGYEYGILLDGVEEKSGRIHGRVTVGGQVPMAVTPQTMGSWELVSEHGDPKMLTGVRYVTEEDLAKAVQMALAEATRPLIERLTDAEHQVLELRRRLRTDDSLASRAAGTPA